jgi:hypothetical protein
VGRSGRRLAGPTAGGNVGTAGGGTDGGKPFAPRTAKDKLSYFVFNSFTSLIRVNKALCTSHCAGEDVQGCQRP